MPDEVHGRRVNQLLFIFAHWHALAKLKLHTDNTLALLDEWTVMFGNEARLFVEETCTAFETRELKREYEARKRSEARKKSKQAVNPPPVPPAPAQADQSTLPPSSSNVKNVKSKAAPSKKQRGRPKTDPAPNTHGTKQAQQHESPPSVPHLPAPEESLHPHTPRSVAEAAVDRAEGTIGMFTQGCGDHSSKLVHRSPH